MFRDKTVFITCIVVFIFGGALLANNQSFVKRINTFNSIDSVVQDPRFKIWEVSIALFEAHPGFGVGLGQFATEYRNNFYRINQIDEQVKLKSEYYKSYWYNKKIKKLTLAQKSLSPKEVFELRDAYVYVRDNEKIRNLTHAHNNFMQMLAENGIVGFAGYVFAFGFILWKNIKNYFTNKNPYRDDTKGGFLCVTESLKSKILMSS